MPNIEGMGFAIPIDNAREIAEELEKMVKFNILILVLELKCFRFITL